MPYRNIQYHHPWTYYYSRTYIISTVYLKLSQFETLYIKEIYQIQTKEENKHSASQHPQELMPLPLKMF